jgi:hypothetical protein
MLWQLLFHIKLNIMEELVEINNSEVLIDLFDPKMSDNRFIGANTQIISSQLLKGKCTIPSYAKDLESTISHTEFLEAVMFAAQSYFKRESILEPAIRVSHEIRGRVPEALGKPVALLRPEDQTLYYQRMAFCIELPTIREYVHGNNLNLSIVGVRSYNLDNLSGKKKEELFKVGIGFVNKVCTNLCLWSDGFRSELRAKSVSEIVQEAYSLFASYRPEVQLQTMTGFGDYYLTERQFAFMIGRLRMYQFLKPEEKAGIPALYLGDSQVNSIIRDYYQNKSFCRDDSGNINLWRFYNLLTSAAKGNYIDTWLDRLANTLSFTQVLLNCLQNGCNLWYLDGQ